MTEKTVEIKKCTHCDSNFSITDKDVDFYNKISPIFDGRKYIISTPTHCPECRQQRRLTFRNERNLYRRKCDFTGKMIISNYSQDKDFKVYSFDSRWSDSRNPLEYGQSYDQKLSFFPQFKDLLKKVPRISLYNPHSENSAYSNHCYYNKNCYLVFNTAFCENVHYSSNLVLYNNDCLDCMTIDHSHNLYECLYSKTCTNSKFLLNCTDCNDSLFLFECKNCNFCFMCTNLNNKRYYYKNKQYTKEEYDNILSKLDLSTNDGLSILKEDFLEFKYNYGVHKNINIENSENIVGDYIYNSKNVLDCFYADDCEDIKYCYDALGNKNCYDTYESSINVENQLECYACNESYNLQFCVLSHFSRDLKYCDYCFNCQDCFGCTGLRNKQYCILNKQYTKQEYEKQVSIILNNMTEAGERGEFFPIIMSPFAYNETVAQDYYPLSQNNIIENGYKYKIVEDGISVSTIYEPLHIFKYKENSLYRENLINGILKCTITGRPFRIIKPELEFYMKHNLPIPNKHPDQRYQERLLFKNTRNILESRCTYCKEEIKTTYDSEKIKNIFCEECYKKEVY